MTGNNDSQRSKFHIDGLSVITDKKSTIIAWSFNDTAWSTAGNKKFRCKLFDFQEEKM